MKFHQILFGLVVLAIFSCEEQPIPIPDAIIPAEGKVILVEELTGVSCPPCAAAAIALKNIAEASDGAVVYYGVHGSLQAEPTSQSNYDFRYPDASELENSFSFFGKPAAAFNRIALPDGVTAQSNGNTWQPFIDAELQKAQVIDISTSTE